MRILIGANAPWTKTGYGTQGASLARRLRDAGHEVVYYCNYGLRGGVQQWEGITCLPSAQDNGYIDPIIQAHVRHVQPDLYISLHDLWPLKDTELPFRTGEEVPWAAWVPVDHEPLSAHNRNVLQRVDYPIAMSQHGQDQMAAAGVKSTYIPHGLEKSFSYTAAGRREFRRLTMVPEDAFLFGSVGINYGNYPNRKGTEPLLEALAQVPDTYLYLHGSEAPLSGTGLNMTEVADYYGVRDRVIFADPYNYAMGYSQNGMNALYSAFDCYVQPTMGEGFGLPVIEAQACGAIVIATDCTSMPEMLCPEASQLVEGHDFLVPDMAHRKMIDVPKLVEAMQEVVEIKSADPQGFRAMKGRVGLWSNAWDWDKLWVEEWKPFLDEVEADTKSAHRSEWHRGQAIVEVREDDVLKRDSTLKSPSVKKELDILRRLDGMAGIIPVLDSGTNEDGTTWFTMPRYTPLMELDDPDAQPILSALTTALTALHEQGVAHRDVHPSNVVVDDDGLPYLIDFEWATSCDGEIGENCVDFEPWAALDHAVPSVQMGIDQRGYHTIVNQLRGLPLDEKTHGFKGVPYQQIDGVGERDCQLRWDIMQPDVEGKTVLDIGCNLGWFVRKALDGDALYAAGWDNDEAVIEAASALRDDGDFYAIDIDQRVQTGTAGDDRQWDVVFCLSVLQHLKDPDRVMKWMMEHGKTLYIEIPPRFITNYMADVLNAAEMIGESERGRPIYRVKVRSGVTA